MLKYIGQRLVAAAITLFIILTVAFCVVRLMPGSVYDDPDLPAEVVVILEARAHLDKPIPVQYYYFIKGIVLENDWGTSVKVEPGVAAFDVIKNRIPISLELNIYSLMISIPLGVLFGTIAALYKNRWADHVASVGVIICISVPSFVFASLMQYFLAFKLGIFPILYEPSAPTFGARMASLVMPIIALALHSIASITRHQRGELIEVMDSEFLLLARTKGLTKAQSIVRHAFRNAAVPLMNIIVPMFTHILGGSMVIERLFSIPGVGGTMIKAINANDHSLTVAVLIFYGIVSVVTNLAVDLSYGIVDPRVRVGGKKE